MVVRRLGPPEVLAVEDVPDPEPGPGEVRIRLEYAGVNFLDVHRRRALQPTPLPYVPGMEGAGVVDAVGAGSSGVSMGDRVAVAMVPGTYAESVVVPTGRVVPVPDGVTTELAAAVLLQGLTADALVTDVGCVDGATSVLVHAVAGGTGSLVAQLAMARGAAVYGTVSSADKVAAAPPGLRAVFVRQDGDFADQVSAATGGRGVDVVVDGIGRDTFDGSLRAAAVRGKVVLIGQASGPVPPLDLLRLADGSKAVQFAVVSTHIATTDALAARAASVLDAVTPGAVRIAVFPLDRVQDAHRLLESGRAVGKLLLAL